MTKEFGGKRAMSIKAALEWAFGAEHAQVDFDDLVPAGARPGVSTIWVMIQRGQLGCKIDGGGRSRPADDAELIAIAVANLPAALGGRAMAAEIAALARAGLAPDWMPDASPRCVPREWRNTKHGLFARAEVVRVETTLHRGRRVEHDVLACPVTYVPTAQQIAMARRRYLDWYGALLHLRADLVTTGLQHISLTHAMPALTPWRGSADRDERAA
jgi:hypothetical protein